MTSSYDLHPHYSLYIVVIGLVVPDQFFWFHIFAVNIINTWGNRLSVIHLNYWKILSFFYSDLSTPGQSSWPLLSSYTCLSPLGLSSWSLPRWAEILVSFLFSLVAGSPWNNVHACHSWSNGHPSSILHCKQSWVVIFITLIHWLCTRQYPLVRGVSFSIL